MPRFNPTEVYRPSSVEEALNLLKSFSGTARIVAGNTTLYELAGQGGLTDVEKLVDIMGLGLSTIREDKGSLRIGATTTFAEISESRLLERQSCYALHETALKITPPQVRNMGTIGGSICSGLPFYDMPVTLMGLDADLTIASVGQEKTVDIDEFFLDYFVTALNPEQMVVEVQVDDLPHSGSSFAKVGRTAADFAVANACARVRLDSRLKKISYAKIALGAVARTPVVAKAAREFLIGKDATDEVIQEAATLAADFEPEPSVHASSKYKKKIIPILVRDALRAALQRAKRSGPAD